MSHHHAARRNFLRHTAQLAAGGALAALSIPSRAALPATRGLTMVHTHTGEKVDLVYAVQEQYIPESLSVLSRFLRDHYTGDVGVIDPQVFDLLYRVRQTLGSARPFEVISGYRCPGTNSSLRQSRGGGVAKHSLHMEGRAIDVRLPGVALTDLRNAAHALGAGGVGFYPQQQFVHLDTGRVRYW